MASSDVRIVNFALRHLAAGKEIANLTEDSAAAQAANLFFEQVREEVLRDVPWPFATKFVTLAKVADNPTKEWALSYRYPSDCLYFRRILSGTRNDNRQSKIPYRIAQDAQGLLIFTDVEDAEAEYTVRVTDPNRYHPDFIQAMALLLAVYIGPSVTGGDRFGLTGRALNLYVAAREKARAQAFNEEEPDEMRRSEFEIARNVFDPQTSRGQDFLTFINP